MAQPYPGGSRPAVLDHIGEGFGNGEVRRRLDGGREPLSRKLHRHLDRDGAGEHERLNGAGQAPVGQDGRFIFPVAEYAGVHVFDANALIIDDLASRDPWTVRGVEIRGRAEAISGIEPTSSYGSGEIIRLHPSRVISWGLDPDRPGMSGRTIPDPGPGVA